MIDKMTNFELTNRLIDIAKNYKTLYVMGCFGAPMTDKNKARYTANHSYNKQASRKKMIMDASPDTFGFDCVCLIKGVLWGWNGSLNTSYGGAGYAINGVPDIGTESIIVKCSDVSTKFNDLEVGELLWMPGHVGIYIGDGLAVECSPAWKNNVQITAVGNIGKVAGYPTRTWQKRGKMPYVDYVQPTAEPGSGDVNGDGKVNAADYLITKRAVLGTVKLTEEQKAAADVDGDGKITAKDYMMSKRIALGTYKPQNKDTK